MWLVSPNLASMVVLFTGGHEQDSFVLTVTPYEMIYCSAHKVMVYIFCQKHFLPGHKSPLTCMNKSDGSSDVVGSIQELILRAYN